MSGNKEILSIWGGENESAKYWLSVLTDLKNRGVKDILIAAMDGLTGFTDVIKAIFIYTETQRCIVNQTRNSIKYTLIKIKRNFVKI